MTTATKNTTATARTIAERVLECLAKLASATPADLAAALAAKPDSVRLAMQKLEKSGAIVRGAKTKAGAFLFSLPGAKAGAPLTLVTKVAAPKIDMLKVRVVDRSGTTWVQLSQRVSSITDGKAALKSAVTGGASCAQLIHLVGDSATNMALTVVDQLGAPPVALAGPVVALNGADLDTRAAAAADEIKASSSSPAQKAQALAMLDEAVIAKKAKTSALDAFNALSAALPPGSAAEAAAIKAAPVKVPKPAAPKTAREPIALTGSQAVVVLASKPEGAHVVVRLPGGAKRFAPGTVLVVEETVLPDGRQAIVLIGGTR